MQPANWDNIRTPRQNIQNVNERTDGMEENLVKEAEEKKELPVHAENLLSIASMELQPQDIRQPQDSFKQPPVQLEHVNVSIQEEQKNESEEEIEEEVKEEEVVVQAQNQEQVQPIQRHEPVVPEKREEIQPQKVAEK